MSIDGSTSISNHCDIYIPVQQVLWRWRWSQCHWPHALKCIASITTRIGKIYFLVIWNLSNHCRFCSFALPFHELWYILWRPARWRDIPQFFGTSKDNADCERFIVLSGGISILNLRSWCNSHIIFLQVVCHCQIFGSESLWTWK